MLEAINSVLQSAPLLRSSIEATSTTDSFAVNPDRLQKVAQAPYLSPYYSIDAVNSQVTLQIRDPQTGKVLQSYPSETDLEIAQHDPARDAQPVSPKVPTSNTGVQVQAQISNATPQLAKPPAPTGQQIAAFTSAAVSGKASGASVSVLA